MPNDFDNLDPVTREEFFLDEIATGENVLEPVTRKEAFLKMIALGKAGDSFPDIDPITRREYFLKKIAGSFTGGGVESETGTFVGPDPRATSKEITFSNSHDRAPDLIFVRLVQETWDASVLTASDRVLWAYEYYGNIITVPVLSGTNSGLYGVILDVTYATSGTKNLSYAVQGLYTVSIPADYGTATNATKPEFYAGTTGFTAKPYSSSKYFSVGQTYEWTAYWIN